MPGEQTNNLVGLSAHFHCEIKVSCVDLFIFSYNWMKYSVIFVLILLIRFEHIHFDFNNQIEPFLHSTPLNECIMRGPSTIILCVNEYWIIIGFRLLVSHLFGIFCKWIVQRIYILHHSQHEAWKFRTEINLVSLKHTKLIANTQNIKFVDWVALQTWCLPSAHSLILNV